MRTRRLLEKLLPVPDPASQHQPLSKRTRRLDKIAKRRYGLPYAECSGVQKIACDNIYAAYNE